MHIKLRICSNKILPSNIVDNVSNTPGIADFFADKYEYLYSCIGFCATEMDSIRTDIDSLSESAGYDSNCMFTCTDVKSVIKRLHPGKSDGSRGLTTEHIKYACNEARRSTDMCSMIIKETMLYYVTHHSSVYCTMLDATKAFDRV